MKTTKTTRSVLRGCWRTDGALGVTIYTLEAESPGNGMEGHVSTLSRGEGILGLGNPVEP